MVICPNCGKNTPEGKFCEHCGASVQTTPTFRQPPPIQQQVYTPQPVAVREEKNVAAATILSVLFPGAGQAYNGQALKGAGLLIVTWVAYMLLIIVGVILSVFVIYDAYITAQKMNKGEMPFAQSNTVAVIIFIIIWIITYVLVTIGLVVMLMGLK
jgi:TM2 domain-containing membrane protein YozV